MEKLIELPSEIKNKINNKYCNGFNIIQEIINYLQNKTYVYNLTPIELENINDWWD